MKISKPKNIFSVANKSIVILLVLVSSFISCARNVGDIFREGKIKYKITSIKPREVEVTKLSKKIKGELKIPLTVTNNSIQYSVTSIGPNGKHPNLLAIYGCTSLTSVIIPSSVTSIGDAAFSDCTSLTSVLIPNSVTSIDDYAFEECTSLISVTIPSSVKTIGDSVFSQCESLTNFSVDSKNTRYKSIDGVLFNYKADKLIKYPVGIEQRKYIIPNSVTSIADGAFTDCSLTSVTIPSSLKSIGERAFEGCKSLTWLTIPSSVTSIGDYAFLGCTSLTSVTIPNSVTSIGWNTFGECKSLISVTIPSSVTRIGNYAFNDCESLTSLIIPSSVTLIGHEPFKNCRSLTSVTIASSARFGSRAFLGCRNLTSIIITNSVTKIGNGYLFENIDKTKCTLYVPKGTLKDYESSDQCKSFKNIKEK